MSALIHWRKDTDLAGIRDAAALAKLPADEQNAVTQLWAEVAAFIEEGGRVTSRCRQSIRRWLHAWEKPGSDQ